MDLNLARKGPICHKCGRDDFKTEYHLTQHLRFHCNGSLENNWLAQKSECKHKSADDAVDEFNQNFKEYMQTEMHDQWEEPFDVLKKRQTKKRENPAPRKSAQKSDELSEDDLGSDDRSKNSADIYFEGEEHLAEYYYQSSEAEEEDSSEEGYESTSVSNFSTGYVSPTTTPPEKAQLPYKSHDGPIPGSWQYQIDLSDILAKHRTDLTLYNEIVEFTKKHSDGQNLKFSSENLLKRATFINKLEKTFESLNLKPKDVDVDLKTGQMATVSVFDAEAMILSILTDEDLMKEENLPPGYDVYTGRPTQPVTHYGEIHTGEAWEPARQHYCGENPENMPIALVIFGDKSHFDLNGALATTPISFTLSCFNEKARNSAEFWRPLGYIPNLSYNKAGERKLKKRPADDSVEDEHKCISVALESLKKIYKRGGISTTVLGRDVVCKVWIHFIIGDTQGNNRWVGHYNGNGALKCPYRDCMCPFLNMSASNPTCIYITKGHVKRARKMKSVAKSKTAGDRAMKSISKQDVDIAWHEKWVPLSNLVHGVYKMVPPELLHTTMEGITEYMFVVLRDMISETKDGQELLDLIDLIHRKLHNEKKRSSERDLPRSASRTALFQLTQVGATERRGNLFLLLCLSYTTLIRTKLSSVLSLHNITMENFQKCLKLYLSMEEWFHSSNEKQEVENARPLIGHVIDLIKKVFPRDDSGRKQGWNIPKMHGLTKMQTYMVLFGCGINFYGGPGETNHKVFVKDTGNNTQCRAESFSSQCAKRYYEILLFKLAKANTDRRRSKKYKFINQDKASVCRNYEGRYVLRVPSVTGSGNPVDATATWGDKDRKREECNVSSITTNALIKFLHNNSYSISSSLNGYTCCKMILKEREVTFRCSEDYMGERWFDWCLVEFEREGTRNETETYAAKVLGFYKIAESESYMNDGFFAVVHTSDESVSFENLSSNFVHGFVLGQDLCYDIYVVPVYSIVHPLYVFKNEGGHVGQYFCSIPRRRWARYFGRKVNLMK